MTDETRDFSAMGYFVARRAVSEVECSALEAALDPVLTEQSSSGAIASAHGIRNLLSLSPSIRSFASQGLLLELASSALGLTARPVKAIYFDKLPEANWGVPWHQDLTIAVRRRADVPGFGTWTTKAGVLHVQPPASVLESVVTLRVHLDDCPAANGALRVVPGNHQYGRLDAVQSVALRKQQGEAVCEARKGDVLVMSPLILHSSPRAEVATHRRIIHIEYSSQPLPDPLQWHN
ncbi:MAG: phytanoyl-CoA dioxygenase family protein [Planctomycetota bacterium]